MRLIAEDEKNAPKNLIAEDGSLAVFILEKDVKDSFVVTGCFSFVAEALLQVDGAVLVFAGSTSKDVELLLNEYGKDSLLLGMHDWSKELVSIVKKHGIRHFDMKEIAMEGKDSMCDAVMSSARDFSKISVLIDLNVIDSPENPGGMTARELIYFVQRLKNLKNIIAFGIVGDGAIVEKLLGEIGARS